MPAPVALVTKPKAADEFKDEAVRILREALEQAEAGEVTAALVIVRYPDGHWGDKRSGTMDFADAIGRLEIVKQSWIADYLTGCK